MNEEEKKAIEYFKSNLEMTKEMGKKWGFQEEIKNNETILNLIEKQDKMINEMAGSIYLLDAMSEYGNSTQETIEYFTRKVGE